VQILHPEFVAEKSEDHVCVPVIMVPCCGPRLPANWFDETVRRSQQLSVLKVTEDTAPRMANVHDWLLL
jgi:hypothetical protein